MLSRACADAAAAAAAAASPAAAASAEYDCRVRSVPMYQLYFSEEKCFFLLPNLEGESASPTPHCAVDEILFFSNLPHWRWRFCQD